nr:hypothetical protein [Tanacetum cinerariifolium]
MAYTTSITKTKAAQYDLPGIKDMVLNIWVPVKVDYDKHALWGISHWREQHKTFYGYARGMGRRADNDIYRFKEYWDIKTKDFIDVVKDYYCCWSSWKRLSVSAVSANG